MKSKIFVFHLLNGFTGSPLVLRNVLLLMVRSGYDVELYTSSGEGFLSGIDGIKYNFNFYVRSRYRLITFFTFFFSQIFLFLILLYKLPKKNSIVFANTILPFSGVLAGKVLRMPVIVHVHEDSVQPAILNRFLFFITNRYSDQIILVSEYLRKNHLSALGEISVVYNSVSEEFNSINKVVKVKPQNEFNVLMLSSLRSYKGLNEFLAISRLLPHVSFTLVLSEEIQIINRFFEGETIPSNVILHSLQKDVHPFYRDADLVINLSKKDFWIETFGLTILEAMHYGVPVIVPTIGGITELVKDDMNGFLIDSTDIHLIVDKINLLSSDIEVWQKMSSKSLEIKDHFSINVFENGILQVLENSQNIY